MTRNITPRYRLHEVTASSAALSRYRLDTGGIQHEDDGRSTSYDVDRDLAMQLHQGGVQSAGSTDVLAHVLAWSTWMRSARPSRRWSGSRNALNLIALVDVLGGVQA